MSRKNRFILIAMLLLTFIINVPRTLAYFTTYTQVKGSVPVALKEGIIFLEQNIGGNKRISVTANADSDPIFVRVRAYASEEIMDRLDYVYDRNEWTMTNDGWYEYSSVLRANETASLDIEIDKINITMSQFNVIVVYEYIPALSDGQGGYIKDWDAGWTLGGGE